MLGFGVYFCGHEAERSGKNHDKTRSGSIQNAIISVNFVKYLFT